MADEFVDFLLCQNPHHPPESSRRSMACVKETSQFCVFQCLACLRIRGLNSTQVKTRSRFKREVRADLARQGRLLTSAPPVIRKFAMDESLRPGKDGAK